MDSHMPVLDGMRAAEAIRAKEPADRRVPIVAVTADVREDHLAQCLASGMDACLTKPFTLGNLHDVLAPWLGPAESPRAGQPPRAAVSSEPTLTIVSLERLRSVFLPGNEAAMREVIHSYLEDSAQLVDELGAAIEQGDVDRVRSSSHSLKSNSAEVGADDLARMCLELERGAIDHELDAMESSYEALKTLYPQVVAALRGELRKL